ncbi:MAG: heavy metal translocating P-type ATPase [Polyangiales bacterium]
MAAAPRELDIEGMTCAACVSRVERVLKRVPGVRDAAVNLATHRATVTVDGAADEALIAAVEKAGYGAKPHVALFSAEDFAADEAPAAPARSPWTLDRVRAPAALAVAAVLMVLAMVPALQFTGHAYVQCALAAAVVFGLGAPIQRVALVNARHGAATMDTLVALGADAAMAWSVAAMARGGSHGHGHLYFETAAMIVAFVLLGRSLEARARARTGDALRALVSLRPRTARVIRGGEERELPVGRVRAGDLVRVGANERFPVDGVIREGEGHVDLSMLTGESMPVSKRAGDSVPGGAVNGPSPVTIETTRVGADSALAQIIALVERAQGSRAPIQRTADRVAAVFVPVVMTAAAGTFVAWRALGHPTDHALLAAVSVLVVACPCALGLATPTAVIVGAGRAAARGILVRDAAVLERACDVTDVVFDKTGTLTRGAPEVTDVVTFGGVSESDALAWAAAVEKESEHPLARAVVARAGEKVMKAGEVKATAGEGVRGVVDGAEVRVGRAAGLGEEARAAAEALEARGRTVAAVSRDGAVVALLGLADAPRPEAREAVAELAAMGVRAHVVSGDHARAVAAVAREVGVEEAHVKAGVAPGGKGAAVEALRAAGRVVAMVGDGVNDAPALAAADVGFAMGSGTDVAAEVAGVTLMRSDPRAVAEAVRLSRAVMATIRQNLFWAFAYNAVAIPLAAAGALDRFGGPMLAAAAMAMSSVTVVTNSLRLRGA